MVQRLRLLKDFRGLSLHPRQGMAFRARIQASDGSAADRDRVSRILRATLQLPAEPGHEPSSPAAPDQAAPIAHRRQRPSS